MNIKIGEQYKKKPSVKSYARKLNSINSTQSYIITTIMKNVVPMSEIRGWSINLIHCHSYIVFTAYRRPQHKNVKTFAVMCTSYRHIKKQT